MEQIKDILRESINSMQLWLNVYQVRPLNNGLQRLYVDRTWQLNNNMAVVLGMQKVKVKAFEVNRYIDVDAAELISTGKYLLPVPYFTNGKYKAVLDEVSRKMNKEDITPFFWLFENLQRTVPLSPTSAIDSEGEVRLFMLMASEFGKFTVEDHYTQAIEPIAKNLFAELIRQLSKHRLINSLTTSRITNHAKFTTGGNSIEDDGKAVFNLQLSGIEAYINLQVRKDQECSLPRKYDILVVSNIENGNEIEAVINAAPTFISVIAEIENGNEIETLIDITGDVQILAEVENFNAIEAGINIEAAPISLSVEVENFNVIESDITVETAPVSLSVEVENFNIIESDIEVEASAVPTITDVEFDGVPFEINQGETVIGVEIIGTDFTAITNDNQVDFGAGLTVDNVTVVDPTLITCDVTADIDATLGNRNLEITFDDAQVATFNDAVEVKFAITRCLEFDGVNDYVELTSGVAGLSNGFTVSFWFNFSSSNTQFARIFSYIEDANNGISINFDNGNAASSTLQMRIRTGGVTRSRVISSSLSRNTWYYMVVSVNSSGSIVEAKINNTTQSTSSGIAPGGNNNDFRIGTATNQYFGGKIAQFALLVGTAANSTQTNNLWNSGNGQDFNVIMGNSDLYLKLNELSGNTAFGSNTIGSQIDGTLINFGGTQWQPF